VWHQRAIHNEKLIALAAETAALLSVPGQAIAQPNGVRDRGVAGAFTGTQSDTLLGAGQPAGLVIQAIRYLRKNGLTPTMIDRLRIRIDAETRAELRALLPRLAVWMQPVVRQIAEN